MVKMTTISAYLKKYLVLRSYLIKVSNKLSNFPDISCFLGACFKEKWAKEPKIELISLL